MTDGKSKSDSKVIAKTNNKTFSPGLWAKLILIVLLIVFIPAALYAIKYYKSTSLHSSTKKIYPDFNKEYIQALSSKNYLSIWNLYSSDYQAYIKNVVGKKEYLSFLKTKFSDIQFSSISSSSCQSGRTVFPYGVEKNHNNTCVENLKLSLNSQNASASSQLADFSYLPLILIKGTKNLSIVGGGPTDLQAPVLYPPKNKVTTIHIPIIMYHRIAPIPLRSNYESDYAWRLDVGLTVTVTDFTAQMNLLQQEGYHPISPNDLFNNLYYNLPLPSNPILLTFDDGRLSDFTNGLPILLKHHYTAVFFIPPALTGKEVGYHDHNQYMNFNQLKILAQDGMYIENHSLYHTLPLWDIAPHVLQTQLSQANADLYTYTQYPIQFIAYDGTWPFSNWRETNPSIQKTISVLTQMGFMLAVQDLGHNLIIEDSQYPYQIPRVRGIDNAKISYIQSSSLL